ncbi:schlafen-like protein 1 [Hydra vulgaris]|uniref:Schlafen-like protein 1 n=1 Tax=Hydra vulgaris TaxID=6087 RepID=A0ABM4BFD6_HYDVU
MSFVFQVRKCNLDFKYARLMFDTSHVLKRSISFPITFEKKLHIVHQNSCSSCKKKEFFIGQRLNTEDRVTEYKRGSGNYLTNTFINHFRKYVCAFLNSEGGRLLVGVGDDCTVHGIVCSNKQEDQIRCQIDHVVQNFYPHVLPHNYKIEFIPVKIHGSNKSVEELENDSLLKVLEISVFKPNFPKCLYINDKDEIYIRRDGSVEGPLKGPQILEWFKSNYLYKYNVDTAYEDTAKDGNKLPTVENYERLRNDLISYQKAVEGQLKFLQDSNNCNHSNHCATKRLQKINSDNVNSTLNKLPNFQSSCTLL